MEKEVIKVKVDQTKLRNEMHFEVQKATRMHIEKPKKGKGSFKRNKRVDPEDWWIIGGDSEWLTIYHS